MKAILWLSLVASTFSLAANDPAPVKKESIAGALGRDPFRRLNTSRQIKVQKISDLEMNSVDQYKMVGVSTGPEKLRALVQGPDGKTHFVTEKMKIGIRNGVITKITSKQIFVREKMTNFMGEEEVEEVVISMPEVGATL